MRMLLAALMIGLWLVPARSEQRTVAGHEAAGIVADVVARLGITPQQFGAKCDGTSDDSAALARWAAALTPANTVLVVPGACVFKTPLIVPPVDHSSIVGLSGRLIYAGTPTSADLITVGAAAGPERGYCSVKGLVMRDLKISSAVALTGGFALHTRYLCEARLENVWLDSDLDGNGNLYNGVLFDNGNSVHYAGVNARARNIAVAVNGSKAIQFTDFFLEDGKIAHSRIGVLAGGSVGGLYVSDVDILENHINFKISQDLVPVPNLQFAFNHSYLDVTDSLSSGYDLWITDPGGGATSTIGFTGGGVASAGSDCIHMEAGLSWTISAGGGGYIGYNCGGAGLSLGGGINEIVNLGNAIMAYDRDYAINIRGADAQVFKCGMLFYGNKPGNVHGLIHSSC